MIGEPLIIIYSQPYIQDIFKVISKHIYREIRNICGLTRSLLELLDIYIYIAGKDLCDVYTSFVLGRIIWEIQTMGRNNVLQPLKAYKNGNDKFIYLVSHSYNNAPKLIIILLWITTITWTVYTNTIFNIKGNLHNFKALFIFRVFSKETTTRPNELVFFLFI